MNSECDLGFSLRPASNADSAAVRDVVFRALAEYGLNCDPDGADADLQDIEGFYGPPDGWFAVLVDATGRVVGSVGLKRVGADAVELRKMYLDAGCRGRGLGRLMLEAALAEARRGGYRRVILETAGVLKEAVALYGRAGFVRLPGSPHVCRCDLVMELRLDGRGGACVGAPGRASSPACD